jgi:hypothetical protein
MDYRLNLGVQRQGLSVTLVKGDGRERAADPSRPHNQRGVHGLDIIVIPGKNVVTAIINRTLNMEDAWYFPIVRLDERRGICRRQRSD